MTLQFTAHIHLATYECGAWLLENTRTYLGTRGRISNLGVLNSYLVIRMLGRYFAKTFKSV